MGALNKTKYLVDAEYEYLQGLLLKYHDQDHRNVTLLNLLASLGCRCGELLNIEVKDIDPSTSSVLIHGTKGSRDRELPLSKALFKDLMVYVELAKLEGRARVFKIKYDRLRQIWAHYKPVDKRIHSLRHTFAIRIYNKTKDIRLVQMLLGHRNVATTSIYQEYNYSLENFKVIL